MGRPKGSTKEAVAAKRRALAKLARRSGISTRPPGSEPRVGRPPGSGNHKLSAQRTAELVLGDKASPLEVMIATMHHHFYAVDPETGEPAPRYGLAHECAKDAAPYLHAKLASIAHTDPNGKKLSGGGETFKIEFVLPTGKTIEGQALKTIEDLDGDIEG
jgi:hypothetical protein